MHGDHDRNFWDLCKEIEKEVRQHDWKSGGRAVSEEVFYDPQGSEGAGEHVDGGGWTGGEYVLGGNTATNSRAPTQTMSRREAMAKAAEERMKRQREAGGGGSGASA